MELARHIRNWCSDPAGGVTILACSSLKQSYRDILRGQHLDKNKKKSFSSSTTGLFSGGIVFLHLDVSFRTVLSRLQKRKDHFLSPDTAKALVQSQLDTLEWPGHEENVFVLQAEHKVFSGGMSPGDHAEGDYGEGRVAEDIQSLAQQAHFLLMSSGCRASERLASPRLVNDTSSHAIERSPSSLADKGPWTPWLQGGDQLVARFFCQERSPSLIYGIVYRGSLVHWRGFGTCSHSSVSSSSSSSSSPPGPMTVYRIASMTKSFTAATIISLRDQGLLGLDDPVTKYLPGFFPASPVTAVPSARRHMSALSCLTVRMLLTMSAGLPTDDPWADRLQGLPVEEFKEFLGQEDLTFEWCPGTHYQYSNLSYALLGRVITQITGEEYKDAVERLILRPLGLKHTGFVHPSSPSPARESPAAVAPGSRLVTSGPRERKNIGTPSQRPRRFHSEPFELEPYGAFASMGGAYSNLRDLSVWVQGFLRAFQTVETTPSDLHLSSLRGLWDEGGLPHPLSRASRREMQQSHRAKPVVQRWHRGLCGPPEVHLALSSQIPVV